MKLYDKNNHRITLGLVLTSSQGPAYLVSVDTDLGTIILHLKTGVIEKLTREVASNLTILI